jgi:hypothetical protein
VRVLLDGMSTRFASALVVLGALSAASACGNVEPPTAARAPSCVGVELIVAASDLTSSVVCGAPGCELGPYTTGVSLGTDPQLVSSGDRTFLLARSEDLVFELDPTCGVPIAEYNLYEGPPLNPHDVAVAPDGSLFVVLYDAARIVIVKDGHVVESIDLSSPILDPDGNPQADAIRIVPVGGVPKAFVTLERLDDVDFLPKLPSFMLRIDVATRKIEETIVLAGRNPFNTMAELNGALFLAEPGDFDSDTDPLAGIERFDTATSTTRLLVSEQDLGGSVAEVAVTEGCGVAIVGGPIHGVNETSLVTFDPVTGKVLASARAPVFGPTPGYDLQGLAWRGDSLYVGDGRRGATGFPVHVFDREPGTCVLHAAANHAPIDLPQRAVALRAAR